MIPTRTTRKIRVGNAFIGGDAPILVQTMNATKTRDVDAAVASVERLARAGAGLIRIAVDTVADADALAQIRRRVDANLSVDLQENFRLAEKVAPWVDKIRYNPGRLHYVEPDVPWRQKVEYLADVARRFDCALRVGVNCGSVDPRILEQRAAASKDEDSETLDPILVSALEHVDFLESIGFLRFCVSIKDSNPAVVLRVNRAFAALRPHIPLHLGVTEAGAPPRGVLKTRVALEPLLAEGVGDTLRVSLTVPASQKEAEIIAANEILDNVKNGVVASPEALDDVALNLASCPSCSRVENERFVELAREIEKATVFARDYPFKIAVMGCRVNGPGETNDADVGLWCGGDRVNLTSDGKIVGSYDYDEIVDKATELLKRKIEIFNAAQIEKFGDDQYVV